MNIMLQKLGVRTVYRLRDLTHIIYTRSYYRKENDASIPKDQKRHDAQFAK